MTARKTTIRSVFQPAGKIRGRTRRAFTFLELMLALTIIAMLGSAVSFLIVGSMNADRFLRSTNSTQAELELAVDRISNNIREAQSGSISVGTGTLGTLTQADIGNGYPLGATVSYTLATDPNNATQMVLMENDQRYGNNILLHNVTTFTVAQVAGVAGLYQVDLVSGGQIAGQRVEERHFKVLGRN